MAWVAATLVEPLGEGEAAGDDLIHVEVLVLGESPM